MRNLCPILLAFMALVAECRSEDLQQERTTMKSELHIRVTGHVLHPVSENLFGQFLERPSWGNETGLEAAVLPGTHQLDPRVEGLLKAMAILWKSRPSCRGGRRRWICMPCTGTTRWASVACAGRAPRPWTRATPVPRAPAP